MIAPDIPQLRLFTFIIRGHRFITSYKLDLRLATMKILTLGNPFSCNQVKYLYQNQAFGPSPLSSPKDLNHGCK